MCLDSVDEKNLSTFSRFLLSRVSGAREPHHITMQLGTRFKSTSEQASVTALISDWVSYRLQYRRYNHTTLSGNMSNFLISLVKSNGH